MEKAHNVHLLPFAESVLEHTSTFENLGNSNAFERVLLDHLTDRQDDLNIDAVSVPRMYVPAELIESHNWPANFEIEDLKARLISCPDETSVCDESWAFTADYKVNGQAYSMVAAEGLVKSNFYDNNGGSHEHTFEPGTAMRFMKTVALGVSYENGFNISNKTPIILPETPEDLRTLFNIIGNFKGEHVSILTSYIADVSKPNRGLIVKQSETKHPVGTESCIDYKLFWRVGNDKATEVISHQQTILSDEAGGQDYIVRYAKRGPTEVDPRDLPLIMDLTTGEENDEYRAVFLPTDKNLDYDVVNTSIMTLIIPFMRKHLHLDEGTPSDIFKIELLEELTD